MCEKCLYRNNCQFIATHENYKTVTGCTAFRSEQQIKSDVAREIFEEVKEAILDLVCDHIDRHWLYMSIGELEKKYESEGKQ